MRRLLTITQCPLCNRRVHWGQEFIEIEKIQYHLDLRKCENKDLVKAIKKEVNENQLVSDSEKAKSFTGSTSSCAYCIILFIAYLSIN